jgi:hypothetical protein
MPGAYIRVRQTTPETAIVGFLIFAFFIYVICPLLLLGLILVVLAMFASFFAFVFNAFQPKFKAGNLQDRLDEQAAARWRKLEELVMELNRPLKD